VENIAAFRTNPEGNNMSNSLKIRGVACAALLLAIPLASSAADSAYGCDSVNFADEILKHLPKVREACHDVSMKNDKVYAHFVGEVVAVAPDALTVRFEDRDGKDISELRLVPTPEVMIKADGKEVPFAKLERGMKIDAYVEHSRWGLYAQPDGKMLTILDRKEL
jgi:hypothetical protein